MQVSDGSSAWSKNYKKEDLTEIVKEVLWTGVHAWEHVMTLYRERACKNECRDKDDVKQHWVKKCVTSSKSQKVVQDGQQNSSKHSRKCRN